MTTLLKSSTFQVKVQNNGGILQPSYKSVTLRNQVSPRKITDLVDVNAIDVTTGSTLVYNSNNSLYEIKKLNLEFVPGNLDGGEF
jgi:hypothetical protein